MLALFNNFSYQNKKQKVEEQRDCFQLEVEKLRGDLAVTRNEGAKEERKQKVHNVSNANPFLFAGSMNDVERNRENMDRSYIFPRIMDYKAHHLIQLMIAHSGSLC